MEWFCGSTPRQPDTTMEAIRIVILIGLAATTASPAWAEESEAVKQDMARLQGEWPMVSGSADGQPMPERMRKQMRRVCQGDEATTTIAGRVYIKAKITIDPRRRPRPLTTR